MEKRIVEFHVGIHDKEVITEEFDANVTDEEIEQYFIDEIINGYCWWADVSDQYEDDDDEEVDIDEFFAKLDELFAPKRCHFYDTSDEPIAWLIK